MASAPAASSTVQSLPSTWPADTMAPVGYLSRKALPIKRADAEPLTREDVQYDLLHHIFSNPKAVFTTATPGKSTTKVTFCDLYVAALYTSAKCSKVLKDKMKDTPAFALELAKISLLTNVGRINTTMAFFPEMKTALRTYHPVPSLQKTDGNAQDAPRIKNCLKAALLPSELKNMPPSTPEEILSKLVSKDYGPCLLRTSLERSRSQFSDFLPYKRAGQKPPTSVVNLVFVLATHSAPLASVHFDGSFNFLDLFLPRNLSSPDRARTFLWLMYYYLEDPSSPNPFDDDYSRQNTDKAPIPRVLTEQEAQLENVDSPDEVAWGASMSNQRNLFLQKLVSSLEQDKKVKLSAPHFVAEPESEASPVTRRSRSSRHGLDTPKDEASFMYYVPSRDPPPDTMKEPSPRRLPRAPREDRTMLQHAWHVMKNSDPLADSDDEEFADEYTRLDYTRRIDILAKMRGAISSVNRTKY